MSRESGQVLDVRISVFAKSPQCAFFRLNRRRKGTARGVITALTLRHIGTGMSGLLRPVLVVEFVKPRFPSSTLFLSL